MPLPNLYALAPSTVSYAIPETFHHSITILLFYYIYFSKKDVQAATLTGFWVPSPTRPGSSSESSRSSKELCPSESWTKVPSRIALITIHRQPFFLSHRREATGSTDRASKFIPIMQGAPTVHPNDGRSSRKRRPLILGRFTIERDQIQRAEANFHQPSALLPETRGKSSGKVVTSRPMERQDLHRTFGGTPGTPFPR
ncbi:hypothetical protein DFS33DRAFT_956893 [Desarmillaria ectypa]|nr:hypothetical protein DFS33DRAFT_956893 [Desarmillaria ectypa]